MVYVSDKYDIKIRELLVQTMTEVTVLNVFFTKLSKTIRIGYGL